MSVASSSHSFKEEEEMKTQKNVVPWCNPEQFLKVYEYLYSPELTKRRWAVDQISVWDTRCHPSLPTDVEATFVLSRAIIQDVLFVNGTSLCQEGEIQMLYSMALVRFVNLSIELHQVYEKQAAVNIAHCLGIPSWIVNLRNEATHAFSPSLPVLRMGADAAMKYLDESFWSVTATKLKSIVKEPENCDVIKNLIIGYQFYKFRLVCRTDTESAEYKTNFKEIRNILKEIKSCIFRNRNQFIDTLAIDGIFILGDIDLEELLNIAGSTKFLKEIKAHSEYSNEDSSLSGGPLPELPSILEEFWGPILSIINDKDGIPYFVEALLYTQANRTRTSQIMLVIWVSRILSLVLDIYKFMDPKGKSVLSKIFEIKNPVFDWERLLFACVSNPCIYTPFVFPLIISHVDTDKDFVRSLMNLLAISQGQALDKSYKLPENRTAFTVEKLKISKIAHEGKNKGKQKKKSDNIWSLAPDSIDFKNIPIGAVFNSCEKDANEIMEQMHLMDFNKDFNYREKFIWGNKNEEDVKDFSIVEQNTFVEDKQIISERKTFLYKKQVS